MNKIFIFYILVFICNILSAMEVEYPYLGDKLRKHMNTKFNEWEKYTSLPKHYKMTTNIVKVGLYYLDKEKNKWIFYQNTDAFCSGFEKNNYAKLKKDILTNDLNLVSLEDIYGSGARIKNNSKESINLERSFQARGVENPYMRTNEFDGVQYSHSEQTFISKIDNISIVVQRNKENLYEVFSSQDDTMILVVASTNEACKNCFFTLNNMLDLSLNFNFFEKVLFYFMPFFQQAENIEVEYTNDISNALPRNSIIFSSFFYKGKHKQNHNILCINPLL